MFKCIAQKLKVPFYITSSVVVTKIFADAWFPKTYTCIGVDKDACHYKFCHGRRYDLQKTHNTMVNYTPRTLYLKPTYGGEEDMDNWTVELELSKEHHPTLAAIPHVDNVVMDHDVYITDFSAVPHAVKTIKTFNDVNDSITTQLNNDNKST